MSDLSPLCAAKRTLATSLLATRAGGPQERRFTRFAVQLVDQTRKRVLARNIGTAGGNEQAMQRRDRVFAAPFVIVDERQDRVSNGPSALSAFRLSSLSTFVTTISPWSVPIGTKRRSR